MTEKYSAVKINKMGMVKYETPTLFEHPNSNARFYMVDRKLNIYYSDDLVKWNDSSLSYDREKYAKLQGKAFNEGKLYQLEEWDFNYDLMLR